MAHSPSPWSIVQVALGPGIIDANGVGVAQVYSPFPDRANDNAALIRSAPELHKENAQLQDALGDAWRAGWDAYREAFDHYDDPDSTVERSAALGKARYLDLQKGNGDGTD